MYGLSHSYNITADAQVELGLRCPHVPEDRFCFFLHCVAHYTIRHTAFVVRGPDILCRCSAMKVCQNQNCMGDLVYKFRKIVVKMIFLS